jgi:cytochrome P450
MLIHILRDSHLCHRVQEEIMTADIVGESDGKTHIDMDKLVSLPLLQSVYLECLRLYMSVPIPRCLRNSVEVDGYKLSAGNYVLIPSHLAHTNEQVWSAQGHPANTFWAERFVHRNMDETARHAPGDFFPYGGGLNLCPGRLIGKQEIFAAVALLLAKFDFEFVGYVDKKGRRTARGPEGFDFNTCESRGMVMPAPDVLVRARRRASGKTTAC